MAASHVATPPRRWPPPDGVTIRMREPVTGPRPGAGALPQGLVTDYARLLSAGDIPRSAPHPVPIFLDPTYGVWMVDAEATPVANCP